MADARTVLIWVGLTRHHTDSAEDLPASTHTLIGLIKAGCCPTEDDLMLEPIIADGSFAGFGVVLSRIRTTLTPHEIRTTYGLPRVYREQIQQVRSLFRKLGFSRAANLYATAVDT